MSKPLFVGEAPSKNEPTPKPIEGRIGRRLADFAGISFDEFVARTERVNLLDVRQDTREKGFTFDMSRAIMSAQRIVAHVKPGQVVVLLGRRVARSVGSTKDYFEPCFLCNGVVMYVVPHPSGVNRWYNEPENGEKMRRFMRSLCSTS